MNDATSALSRAAGGRADKATWRVVGIDPGLANIGLGAVEESGNEPRLLGSRLVKTSSRAAQAERLLTVRTAVAEFISLHRPQALAIEGQYFHQQREVAYKVGQAVGVVLLTAAECGVPVYEYGPLQVKQALVGNGRADKAQVAFMVRALLKLSAAPSASHVADALALALTHLQHRRVTLLNG